ncbi:efflux RND transporter periplasmic adaptor subunit [Comamonas terrigena]|uniref:efflux RND transporter periplasmic adaptor subunit n=1 Tax=Comamonas terrigena TaxID=32013 RepID=UPI002449EE57|nr:efflux RND transporter periplasmic adaptor subunit [Comamonas terrigena]MDH1701760.1 efflux RND transporter periplasmic adaptor subunit [Comamonas terrigena]
MMRLRGLRSGALGMACWGVVLAAGAQTALTPPTSTTAPAAKKPAAALPGVGSALEQRDIRAQLAPRRYTTLAAEIGAKVQRLPVVEGAAFRQGQLLVQFDCSLQQAQLNKAQAGVDATEKTWRANQRLAELNSVGKIELDTSHAEWNKARADLSANRSLLGKCQISAPYAGRIAEQKIREQQYAQAGQPLLDIIDDSVLELEFLVPSRWLSWLQQGTAFEVRIDETGKTYPAKVQRLAARVDPVSQSIKVNAAIHGKFPELIAGMSGQVLMAPPVQK